MQACYVLSAITTLLLGIGFFQSFLKFKVFAANHLTFMVLTCIIYAFTETLTIFFFVGTGVSIKEYTQQHNLPPEFRQRSFKIKMKVYPPLLLNMLFMIVLFIVVGAVDTNRIPLWAYTLFFAFCIFDYIRIKIIQNSCFKDNTQVILQMSGIR